MKQRFVRGSIPWWLLPRANFGAAALTLVALMVLGLSGCSTEAPPSFNGKVIRVHDGDTLTVDFEGTPVNVRLARIDAPELAQDFGLQSRNRLKQLCLGQVVHIDSLSTDRNDRIIANVIDDGVCLNDHLVSEGLAWRYDEFDKDDRKLIFLQTKAKIAHRGLWSDDNQIPPWEFRRAKKGQAVAARVLRNQLTLAAMLLSFTLICVFIIRWKWATAFTNKKEVS